MRNSKRGANRGGMGVDAVVGAVDCEVGTAKSRAAARILAEQWRQGNGRTGEARAERVQSQSALADAMCDPDQAWTLAIETIGGDDPVSKTVFAPAWMDVEDVRRFLYGDE